MREDELQKGGSCAVQGAPSQVMSDGVEELETH